MQPSGTGCAIGDEKDFGIISMTAKDRDERLKIAIVLMHFNYGGAEKMVSLLASHLDLSRFEVRVFCVYGQSEGNAMERVIEDCGVPIVHLGKGRGFSLEHVAKMRKMLEAYNADVVHTHLGACIYCSTWAIRPGRRLLHTLHNIPEKELGGAKSAFMRFLYHSGHAVPVAISKANKELTASYYGLTADKVEMVVNPVDVELFADECPKPWGERTWDFVHVARFNEPKNHRGLVDAVATLVAEDGNKFGGVRVALVGTGPLESEIRERVSSLGLDENIKFLGLRDDIPDLLHDSRCFILPSVYEGLPMSILEAMAAGLPVLATAVGGVPDIVEDGVTGILVEPGNPDAFAGAMGRLLESPRLMQSLAAAGKLVASQYDCPIVAAGYSELYEKYRKQK